MYYALQSLIIVLHEMSMLHIQFVIGPIAKPNSMKGPKERHRLPLPSLGQDDD